MESVSIHYVEIFNQQVIPVSTPIDQGIKNNNFLNEIFFTITSEKACRNVVAFINFLIFGHIKKKLGEFLVKMFQFIK